MTIPAIPINVRFRKTDGLPPIRVNQAGTNIRVNISAPFPSLVLGDLPITITKNAGDWIIGFDYSNLANTVPALANYPTDFVLVFDSVTQTYFQMSLQAMQNAFSGNSYRIVTAAGAVTIVGTDQTILLNKTVGAATNIILPTSVSRLGAPVTVKDYKGDANANNITFVPNGTETIDGFSPADAAANGTALIDINYGRKTLYPLTAGGWWT